MIILQQITPLHAALYRQVRLSALREAPAAFGSTYEEESRLSEADWIERASAVNLDDAIGYFAMSDQEVCGLVRGKLEKGDRLQAHVASMWVSPLCRRTGVASRLLSAIEEWAACRHALEITLTVTHNNAAAIALYSRHGFRLTGRTEPYPNDADLFEVEMSKPLL